MKKEMNMEKMFYRLIVEVLKRANLRELRIIYQFAAALVK